MLSRNRLRNLAVWYFFLLLWLMLIYLHICFMYDLSWFAVAFKRKMKNSSKHNTTGTDSFPPIKDPCCLYKVVYWCWRRKIRLIEGNAKSCHLKKFTSTGILRQVFICLRPITPYPSPSDTLYTFIQYNYLHREGVREGKLNQREG